MFCFPLAQSATTAARADTESEMKTEMKTDEQQSEVVRAKPLRIADLLPPSGRIQVIGFDTAIGADGKKVISIRKITPVPVTDGGSETLPASVASDDLAERVAAKVVEKLKEEPTLVEPEKLFITVDEAAKILGITRDAAEKRIERRQIPGVVRTGRRIQIDKARMLAGLARRSR